MSITCPPVFLIDVEAADYRGSLEWTLLVETIICSTCSPHSPPSPSLHPSAVEWSGLSTTEPQPITTGAPIACQSSDKMDFQLSQGSQAGSGRMENRQTSAAHLPLLTFCLLLGFFSFYLLLCSAPVPLLLSALPSVCLCDLLAGNHVKWKYACCKSPDTGALSGRQCGATPASLLSQSNFNSGWIFN